MRFRPKRTLTYLLAGVSVFVVVANYISYNDRPVVEERHPLPDARLLDPTIHEPMLIEERLKKYDGATITSRTLTAHQSPSTRRNSAETLNPVSTEASTRKTKSALPSNGSTNEIHRQQFVRRIKWIDDASSWSAWIPKIDRHHQVTDDRILEQMNFIPRNYRKQSKQEYKDRGGGVAEVNGGVELKTIYVPSGLSADTPLGTSKFLLEKCPVSTCNLTTDSVHEKSADLRLLQADVYFAATDTKPPGQIWMIWILESPPNTIEFSGSQNLINWTATYRWDSTIVTPYAKFVPFSSSSSPPSPSMPRVKGHTAVEPRNYASNKTKMVAWFVSNCNAKNRRWEFTVELSKYIPVDIYGACGSNECPRSVQSDCNSKLSAQYKFYLSFENSNCDHYITEKLFELGLGNEVVPIVMGARKADYLKAAPPGSYIHVEDFESVEGLANHLLKLNASDHLYNEYFRWKGSGEFINTKFWCRLCALLHDDHRPVMWYTDFQKWWTHGGSCTADRWNGS